MKKICYLLLLSLFFAVVAHAQGYVTLYSDSDFKGAAAKLYPGRYTLSRTNVGRASLSSMRIPPGLKVVVYDSDEPGTGNKTRFTGDMSRLPYDWNDRAASVVVEQDNITGNNNNNNYNPSYNNGGNNYANRNDGVTLFSDPYFRGASKTFNEGSYPASNLGIGNDMTSSLKIPSGWSVTVFENDNFTGRSQTFTSDINTFRNDWNDRISSVRVSRGNSGGGSYYPQNNNNNNGYNNNSVVGVSLFSDPNYRGARKILVEGSFPSYMLGVGNDKTSSIEIPGGWSITVFENDNYNGKSQTFTRSINTLNSDWNDRISSVIIRHTGNSGGYNTVIDGVSLFGDPDYRGPKKTFAEGSYNSGSLGIGNDKASSIDIPFGWAVTVFEDDNFNGRSQTFTKSINRLYDDWNDKISSIIVRRW